MQIHQLKPKTKRKSKKRVGRGGIKGTYSGKGLKGQNARSGRKLPPIVRSVIKRYPKLRGYKFNSLNYKPAIVDLSTIEKKFEEGANIFPKDLIEKGIVKNPLGRVLVVKILAKGDIKKNLTINDCLYSNKAKEKIEKAGGKANTLKIKEPVVKEKKKRIKKEKTEVKKEEKKVEKKVEKPKKAKTKK
ncbi:MAG: uL15 family ribosomal protein [Candidatus Pacebacteria bacterium]|nr:uL15 family ribosomal protein [Candidatus Paceibacterota bacterium]